MKVTALIPDELVEKIKQTTGGKNITESMIIALEAYLASKTVDRYIKEVSNRPLEFNEDFNAYKIRQSNRNR
jgi:hypothetical protein